MLRIYTFANNDSAKKVRKYLQNNNIDYIERNLLHEPITDQELSEIKNYSEKGWTLACQSNHKKSNNLKNHIQKKDKTEHLVSLLKKYKVGTEETIVLNPENCSFYVGYNENCLNEIKTKFDNELKNELVIFELK